MALHSSPLAWKVPWTEEPGRLQSMGVAKNGTRLSNFIFTFTFSELKGKCDQGHMQKLPDAVERGLSQFEQKVVKPDEDGVANKTW